MTSSDFGFDTANAPEVVTECYEIRRKFRDLKMNRELIKKYHMKFAEDYENLFQMVTSTHCDDVILNKLLKLRMGMHQEKFSAHDASVGVGELLVETYVKPVMEKKENENKE
jgi:hypothetical protein